MAETEPIAATLRRDLEDVIALRRRLAQDAALSVDVLALKDWQVRRLSSTYADLLASPRYRPATEFFLSDLYGAKDFARRDEEFSRVVPAICRMLPAAALGTIAAAVRLDLLSEALDQAVARAHGAGGAGRAIDDVSYATAYRAAGRRDERERQIALAHEIGTALDRLTRSRALRATLSLMRGPARAAGFGDLQAFLERGFEAFRRMDGAQGFLDTIVAREQALMTRLFAAHPRPFDFDRSPLPV